MEKADWITFFSVLGAVVIGGAIVSSMHHVMDRFGKHVTGHTSKDASGTAVPPEHPEAV